MLDDPTPIPNWLICIQSMPKFINHNTASMQEEQESQRPPGARRSRSAAAAAKAALSSMNETERGIDDVVFERPTAVGQHAGKIEIVLANVMVYGYTPLLLLLDIHRAVYDPFDRNFHV